MALGYRRDPKGVALEREREEVKKGNGEGKEREWEKASGLCRAASDVTLGCLAGNWSLFITGRPWNFPRHGGLCTAIIYAPIIARGIMRETVD